MDKYILKTDTTCNGKIAATLYQPYTSVHGLRFVHRHVDSFDHSAINWILERCGIKPEQCYAMLNVDSDETGAEIVEFPPLDGYLVAGMQHPEYTIAQLCELFRQAREFKLPKYASLGSVSHGTLRIEDLLSNFADTLRELDSGMKYTRDIYEAYFMKQAIEDELLNENGLQAASEIVSELSDYLNEFNPPYCYFGTSIGDGTDFGFWVDTNSIEEAIRDGSLLRVDDTSEVPIEYVGHVLHVNDHGNMTLYIKMYRRELIEIWGVV